MYQTIQLSSCVSVQGVVVAALPNGETIVREGAHTWRGRPIAPYCAAARPEPKRDER